MPELLLVEPDETYRAAAADNLSSHALLDFIRSPQIHHLKATGVIPYRDSPAFQFGRAAHMLILEGSEVYESTYTVSDGPINDKTGKPYGRDTKKHITWRDQQKGPILSTAEDVTIRAMAESVAAHEGASALLKEGQAEGVARAEWAGVCCQIRCDWYSGLTGLNDLKTCASIDQFGAEMRKFGSAYRRATEQLPLWRLVDTLAGAYCVQMAFYFSVLLRVTGEEPDVHLTAVEKVFPHRVGVWHLPDELLRDLAAFCEQQIKRWAKCKADDSWPSGFEAVRGLEAW